MKNTDFETAQKMLFGVETSSKRTPSHMFDEQIRNKWRSLQRERQGYSYQDETEDEAEENCREIGEFIRAHVRSVGKEQAVKDFQSGLNFLHKGLIEPLKEDGKFGEKTFKAFYDVFKHYDIEIIKNAIRKGALSNTVIGTSSNKDVNTSALVNQVQNNLGGVN